jgi:WD40 repeat protein/serine/threonine protein kinase
MSSETRNAKQIFLEAIGQHAPDEWPAYLDQACGNDAQLRRRVEILLEAHVGEESLLDSPAMAPAASTDQATTEGPSTEIGPYKLLQQIGEGGMGIVYMAEQTGPVERRVALKIIKPGMDTRQVIARFEAEEQALAMMDHPNIARVLDAGTTDSGRPYFVMELFKGIPITQYCDEQHLTPRERLELFLPVCQAVQHAHQKGIIHRDIKPSNVLVAEYDDRPVPKVIDFGVAKAISQRLTEKTMFTELGQVVGTVDYMSPEQAKLSQSDVDTRSDIYSLGVLLYELLTGETPFDPQRLRSAAFDELLRIIREEEPPKPSMRVSSSHCLPSIAANRHVEPKRLSTLVRGELDWIVMKALEKDRDRRYESASAFVADVDRYLTGKPVQACPPSRLYRLRKLVRRNRGLLVVTLVVFLSLVIGAGVAVWQAIRATQAHQTASDRLVAEVAAKRESREMLWHSYLNQARARRRSVLVGRRFESLAVLREAAKMLPELEGKPERVQELRHEWIACSALPVDFRVRRELRTQGRVWAVDPSCEHYFVADSECALHMHRLADDKEVACLPGHEDFQVGVSGIRLSADGRFLAVYYSGGSGAASKLCRVWDLKDRRIIREVSTAPHCVAVDFTPDSRLMAYGREDNQIHLLDLSTGEDMLPLAPGPAPPWRLRISPDGRRYAACFRGKADVYLHDLRTGKLVRSLSHPSSVGTPSWSFDGRVLAVPCDDLNIYVWDVETGQRRATLRGHRWLGIHVAFWPHSYRLSSGSWDGTRRVWDAMTGLELLYAPRGRRVSHISLDERQMVSRTQFGGVAWDVATSRTFRRLAVSAPSGCERFSVAIHPSGRLLACGTNRGIHLWDLAADREIAVLPVRQCYGVLFHPRDGSLIASGDSGLDRRPLEIDEQAGRVRLGPAEPLGTEPIEVAMRLSLSPDGRYLAAVVGSQALWCDLQTHQTKVSPHKHQGAGHAQLSVSSNGRWVASGPWHRSGLKVWDTQSTQGAVKTLWPDLGRVQPKFDPSGEWLFASANEECRVYEVGTWRLVDGIAAREAPTSEDDLFGAAAASPDGELLAIRSSLSTIRLVETSTWRELATLEPIEPLTIQALAFGPDGSQLAAASVSGPVQLWDLREIRRELRELGLDWDMAPYPPLPSADVNDQPLEITEISHSSELLCLEEHTWTIWRVAFSPDGCTALSLGGPDVLLWELPSGKVLRRFAGYEPQKEKGASCGCFFPRGDWIVVGGVDGAVRVFDVRSGEEVKRFQAPAGVADLDVTSDGRRVVAGMDGGSAIVWDVQEDREHSRYELHSRTIRDVALSPDGRRALSAGYDGFVHHWEVQTGKVLRTFGPPQGDAAFYADVAFSPDGRHALVGCGELFLLLDLESGGEVRRFSGHAGNVVTVAFTPDGRRAVSAGNDHTVRVWDLQTGSEIARLIGHTAMVTDVAVSPDGRLALSGSHRDFDHTVRLWQLPDSERIDE